MAEALELVDEAAAVALGVLGVAAVEELLAELVIGNAAIEDVVGGGQDLVAGRDGRFGVSARDGGFLPTSDDKNSPPR